MRGARTSIAWLFMGYTSSSVWGRLFPKNTAVLSNMDGLEWKRSKYPRPVQLFLRHAEKLAVRYSLGHIADSPVIQEWLRESYGIQSQYIPYGATVRSDVDPSALEPFGLKAQNYYMIMARMEPENHIDIILEGFVQSACDKKMIVVGNTANSMAKAWCKNTGMNPGLFLPAASSTRMWCTSCVRRPPCISTVTA